MGKPPLPNPYEEKMPTDDANYRIAARDTETSRWWWWGYSHPRRGEFQVWTGLEAWAERDRIAPLFHEVRIVPGPPFVLPGEEPQAVQDENEDSPAVFCPDCGRHMSFKTSPIAEWVCLFCATGKPAPQPSPSPVDVEKIEQHLTDFHNGRISGALVAGDVAALLAEVRELRKRCHFLVQSRSAAITDADCLRKQIVRSNERERLLREACEAFIVAWEKCHQLEKTDVAVRMARAALDEHSVQKENQ